MKNWKMWRGFTVVTLILAIITISMTFLAFEWSGHINIFLNVEIPKINGTEESMYYKSAYGLSDDGLITMLADSNKHDTQTIEEGAVLLKNTNATLPLSSSELSVTLFGRAVADPVYRGNSGGPSLYGERLVSLYSALEDSGFSINDKLFNAYKNSDTKRNKPSVENPYGDLASIGEEDISFYTEDLKESYENDYNDVAVVMFARDAGEGKDLFPSDADGISQLALHPQESDLLLMIQDSGKFNKVIVLINSAYPMELGWIDEEKYGVDAALWIGGPGLIGFKGVANILTGVADPSGSFVDTYAANSLSSAAVQNAFSFDFTNLDKNYIIEAEGIYVGYKYYETRYQDYVLNINNVNSSKGAFVSDSWNYADEMVYPFGYGLSYADFSQEIISFEWDQDNHKVNATVKVTNEGYPTNSSYSGKSKSVVQLYVQLPYVTGNAQKSAIQLIDFEKTALLGVGESELIEFEVDDYIFATYDENAVNGADTTKNGAYVFDPGNYYFSIGEDSHDALNNVLASRKIHESLTMGNLLAPNGEVVTGDENKVIIQNLGTIDNVTYATSQYTGNIVSNLFDNIDINDFYDEDILTYMTRDDWNTFPEPISELEASSKMLAILGREDYEKPLNAPAYNSFKQGEPVTIKLIEMKDIPFDDPKWELFLNQLTVGELTKVIGENFGQPAIPSIGKPNNVNTDGPSGTQGNYKYGDKIPATVHVNEVVAASTWNKELLSDRGDFIAEDALFVRTSQLWSPGANIHRTPFSGRNFEYYSEDSVLSYIASAHQTKAMQAKGLMASPKHFVGNDQETNRSHLMIFMNEQTLRQGPLKGFEGAFTKGGALGTMLSFTAIGAGNEFYTNAEILTQVLRNEWGFKGLTITDSVKGEDIPTVASLVAGVDTFNADASRAFEVQQYLVSTKDGHVLESLRLANKRFYYGMVHTNMMNGVTVDTVIEEFTPWWQTTLRLMEISLGIVALGSTGMFVYSTYILNNKRKGKENEYEIA